MIVPVSDPDAPRFRAGPHICLADFREG